MLDLLFALIRLPLSWLASERYSVLGGLYQTFKVQLIHTATLQGNPTVASYFQWSAGILPTMLVMVLNTALLCCCLRWSDRRKAGFGKSPPPPPAVAPGTVDADVLQEAQRATVSDVDGDYGRSIRVQNLSQAYPKPTGQLCGSAKEYTYAVKGVNFQVEAGQLFGLLGPNGAGKTSTLAIMTGEQQASGGDAQICGHSITKSTAAAFRSMGFCPQHSALWPKITVMEHLTLYAKLKGFVRCSFVGMYVCLLL